MKLIAMKFRGFGPYKGEYAIDFAALTRSHMFLIDGQTGAGKTTILDCLSFALYGSISGGETASATVERQRVRSRFLTGERTETYVDLIFRIGDDYYEVRRTPQYQQPKARGEGVTTHNATAKLMRLGSGIGELAEHPANDPERYFDYARGAGHAEAISTRTAEVGREIPRLIGLDRNQFARTIMLAQGQFAMFLSMRPRERTGLIRDLFGARVYEEIQKELDERRRDMRKETDRTAGNLVSAIGVARKTARDILERRGVTADADHESELLSDGRWGLDRDKPGTLAFPVKEPDEIRDILRLTVSGVDAERDELARESDERTTRARTELAAARALHETATALRDAAARERDDVTSLRDLAAGEPDIMRARRDLERADAAQPIIDLGHDLESLRAERDRLSADASRLLERLDAFPAKDELESRRERALRRAAGADAARRDLERADDHERLIHAAERAAAAHEQARTAHETALETDRKARRALDGLPPREDVDRRLQDIAERLGGEEGLTKELEQARRVLEQAERAEHTEAIIPGLEQRRRDAEAAQATAERTLRTVRESIAQAGVAAYAAKLRDGQPCPVCGSIDHPHPAVEPDDAHDETELDELEQRVDRKRRAAEQARAAVSDARRDLDAQRGQCGGLTVEQARTRVGDVRERIADLDGLRERRHELQRTRTVIDEAEHAAQDARQELAAAAAKENETRAAAENAAREAAGHDAQSVERERADARRRLDEAEHDRDEAERIKRTITERDDVEGRYTERRAQSDAASRLADDAARKLQRALASSGRFTTLEQARDAGMDERDRRVLRDDIQRHDDDVKEARTNLRRSRTDLHGILAGLPRTTRIALGLSGRADADATDATDGDAGDATPGETSRPIAYGDDGKPTPLGEAIDAIDTTAMQSDVREAERRDDEAGRLAGELAVLERNWTEQTSDMERAATLWEQAVARSEPVLRMAHLASGERDADAGQRMDLITYAIAARFHDVLDRANELLADIQGGVYELRLDETGGPAVMKAGLSLTVFDRRTEQERDPGTLSGGETFFVSLALALALADIIRAENGGVEMDTLFVDEGFGTLSEEYLSDVMGMLRRIARTRDVGIISHVDWLKDQIAERITVSRITPDGESRLKVIA